MARVLLVLLMIAMPLAVGAQQALPSDRYTAVRDLDYPGSDLTALFDTTLQACRTACSASDACVGFTFNTRSNACFPKASLGQSTAYQGAISAQRVLVSDADEAAAQVRLAALQPPAQDLTDARALAAQIGLRYPSDGTAAADLMAALQAALARVDSTAALRWLGQLVGQSDAADDWMRYAETSLRLRDAAQATLRRTARQEAMGAALNAYLRAPDTPQQATALQLYAQALEVSGRGRDMIAPLRLAQSLQPRTDIAAALDRAIATYGFRITDHQVDSDAARPRVCANFSDPLVQAGFDYEPYVRTDVPGLVVTVEDRALCLDGVRHGDRLNVTFRQGLPAANGERLFRDVTLALYVRNRRPLVRFPGRGYVLPAGGPATVPVETVNVSEIELTLSHVTDRNLVRAVRDDYFGRPLSQWQERSFNSDLADVIWEGTGTVENPLNEEVRTRLPLGDALAEAGPGVYVLSARVPGSDPFDQPAATQWFVLSDLGLSTWQGNDGLSAMVRRLSDATAVLDARVQLVSQSNAVLATAQTDADGLVAFAPGLTRGRNAAAPALIQIEDGEDFVFLPLTDPAFDLSDRGVEGRAPAPPVDLFLTTDRGAYRPGATIHVTALTRDAQASAIANLPVTAILHRPDGVEFSRTFSAAPRAGGHVIALPLGAEVPRGTWRIDLFSDLEAAPLASETILVEDFVPERLDLTMTLADAPLDPSGINRLTAEATYLFGAPGADLVVEGEVRVAKTDTLALWPDYRFGRHDAAFAPRQTQIGPARTNEVGQVSLPLTLPQIESADGPFEATATLRVLDGAGRPVERQIRRSVASVGGKIGIKPAFDNVLAEGATAVFDLISVGATEPVPAQWTVNRVETRYQWYQIGGTWAWEPITRRTRIAQGDVALSAAPTVVEAPTTWGDYELIVETTVGGYTASSLSYAAGWYGAADASNTPDRLPVSLDAESYVVGDTATVRIDAPTDGTAILSVLSDRVIARNVLPVIAGENTTTLEVTEAWGTGAYVTVSLLSPGVAPLPTRALGLAHAAVDPGSRALSVAITAPDDVSGQTGTTRVTVEVDGLGEQPGFVTLAAVDLGILNLTGFDPPDPQGHYFGQRRLGVELRDLYGRLIDGQSGALGQIRSGGDAGSTMSRQGPPPTEAIMAQFSGLVELDADGRAEILISRPDFNGTIRLMAVAWSASGVGQAHLDMQARDPVTVSAALPRFLAPGDQSRLGLSLTDTTGTASDVAVQVSAPALRLGEVPNTVSLRADGTVRINVPIAADAPGDHAIDVAITRADGSVLRKALTLGVRRTGPAVAETRRLSLAPGEALTLDDNIFAGLAPASASATLSAGSLARFDVPGLLQQLDRYPYGCTEQVTSAAMPLLYLSDLAPDAGLQDIDARVDNTVARVLTRQASNGSFGLWSLGSGEFWLDAYVTDFLSRARMAGYAVPDRALQLALDNLRNRVNYAPAFDRGGEDIAYALMVLAREGAAQIGDLRYYADARSDAFATPLALAQLGAALASYGEQTRADGLFAAAVARIDAAGTEQALLRSDFGTQRRDAAGVLHLAAEVGSAQVDQAALSTAIARGSSHRSTQEAAQILMAAAAVRRADVPSGLSVDGVAAADLLVHSRVPGQAVSVIQNTSQASQDVTLTTFGVPVVPRAAGGYGYAIAREAYALDGTPASGPWSVGERRVIVLRIQPFEETGARLVIDDPLPAGIEIDNPNLLRSGDVRDLPWLDPATAEHAEFRSDRFFAAVDHQGSDAFHLAYIARAVSPGDYHHPAALVEDMYRPEYRAITKTGRTVVVE